MPSILPIILAQLNSETTHKNLNMRLDSYDIHYIAQRK